MVYFVAVAEELHFGRAARRLGIAQPPLSRAIRRLEHRIGVPLLIRSTRTVALTEAGEVLLHESLKALDAVTAAARRTRRAGRGEPRLILAAGPDHDASLVEEILVVFATEPEALPLDVVACEPGEQAAMLRDGRADLALLVVPADDAAGFETVQLAEQRLLAWPERSRSLAVAAFARAAAEVAAARPGPLPPLPHAARRPVHLPAS